MSHPTGKNARWWRTGFFGLHYDLHARKDDTALGAELTPDHLRRQLEKIQPDYVQCDCKGHPGYASYPTRVGSPSPGIVKDALRIHRDVTREMNIPLSVHYSGVWDKRAVELHPDWSAIDQQGKPVLDPQGTPGIVCLSSPYVDELMIPQMLEIIDLYDVDGFWVDGDNWAARDCYCDRCRQEFFRRTGLNTPPPDRQQPGWPQWRSLQRALFTEYVGKYVKAVHGRKDGCAVCSNWIYSIRQPGSVNVPVDYLSGDFTHSYAAESAELEGRYLDGHRMPWNLMSWTFTHTTPQAPWMTKTVAHLSQEAAEVMSCGGGVFLYSVPRRSGLLTDWQHDILAETARFCRRRQPFTQGTCSVPETAILSSDAHIWHHSSDPFCMGDGYFAVTGALHIMVENQYHVDVLDETRLKERIHAYALVIVGEQNPVSPGMEQVLESYVLGGGILLITGSHLAEKHPRLTGVVPAGEPRTEGWCLPSRGETFALPPPWVLVDPRESSAYACVIKHQQLTEPPQDVATQCPGVTIRRAGRGVVAAIHGSFMATYYHCHNPRMRAFLRDLLETLPIHRKVVVSGPPTLEVTLRSKDNALFVHLVNRAVNPTLGPRTQVVEEVPPVDGVQVSLRLDCRPAAVTLEPGNRRLGWSHEDGWLRLSVPRVEIHDIVAVRIRSDPGAHP